jgi:hypothetical protein
MIYAGYSKSERKIRAEEVLTQVAFLIAGPPPNHPEDKDKVLQ